MDVKCILCVIRRCSKYSKKKHGGIAVLVNRNNLRNKLMYCSNFSSSGRSNLDSIERRWNNTVLQKRSLMDKTASQQPLNLYFRSYNLFKEVIWKTEVFTSVLCNLCIYFIFSLVYVCFSWHLCFIFKLLCSGKGQI